MAAIVLGRGVRSVSILGDDESGGRVINHPRGAKWIDRLEEADYASSWGGFINGRTRRKVGVEVMILLAGGLVTMEALGVERHEVGMGLEKLDEEESAAMVSKYGGEQSEWQHMVTGGDYEQAMDLVLKVSGGEGRLRRTWGGWSNGHVISSEVPVFGRQWKQWLMPWNRRASYPAKEHGK